MHEAIFDQVNQQLNVKVHWLPMSGAGTSNWLYQGSNHDQVLILRVNAQKKLAFGVSREREAAMLELIQGYPWAMRVFCNRPDLGWCVMAHHGLSLGPDTVTGAMRTSLLEAVSGLQQIDPPDALSQAVRIDYPALFECYQASLNKASDPIPWLERLARLVQLVRSLPVVPECLTHHDLHPGNCCWRSKQIALIDWEYSGLGNPWFDVASLHHYCDIPAAELHGLPAFTHLSRPLFELGLQQAGDAVTLLEKLWYKVRA